MWSHNAQDIVSMAIKVKGNYTMQNFSGDHLYLCDINLSHIVLFIHSGAVGMVKRRIVHKIYTILACCWPFVFL